MRKLYGEQASVSKGGDDIEAIPEDTDYSKYPQFIDPYGLTQEAILKQLASSATMTLSVAELAQSAHELGPVDSTDLAYSAAMGLHALGLVVVNSVDRTVKLNVESS